MKDTEKLRWMSDLYNEMTLQAIKCTPKLYVWSKEKNGTIEPFGCAVLLEFRGGYYLITAKHCLKQDGQLIKFAILDEKGIPTLIKGDVITLDSVDNTIDLGLVKLLPESQKMLAAAYNFINEDMLRITMDIPDNKDYLLVGFPNTKTKIDNGKYRISTDPLIYIAKSKDDSYYNKSKYKKAQNIIVGYNRRRGMFLGESEMNMNPKPKGISGCGLWYMLTSEVASATDVKFHLCGIMTEYDSTKNIMVAVRIELLAILLKKAMLL